MYDSGSDDEAEGSKAATSKDVCLGDVWEAVGPFPSGMREHPLVASPIHAFSSGTFPADPDVDFARRPYSLHETWPSEYGNGGRAGWTRFKGDGDGWVEVVYPGVRWGQLRDDHGWASLQYQTLLRTYLTIPQVHGQSETPILIDVIQGAEYAFVPVDREPDVPTIWYNGDLYNYASSSSGSSDRLGRTSNLARSVSLRPGRYVLLVRAIYEIRMFGDPRSGPAPDRGPVIRLKVQMEVDRGGAEIVSGSCIVPDVIDGQFMGDWASIGVRAGQQELRIVGVRSEGTQSLDLTLPGSTMIRASQIRPIALRVTHLDPLSPQCTRITVTILAEDDDGQRELSWSAPLRHHRSRDSLSPFQITFASPSETSSGPPASVSYAMVVPPAELGNRSAQVQERLPPVILALHGAGVDAANSAWADVIPRRKGGWAVLPTGRTEWGEDWHGGSMADAWAARDALATVAGRLGQDISHETLLIGHSNGGQGAWHLAARYPDRVSGVIAASGWLTIHDYVPYTQQTSGHFADPALLGILRASLTPYDNDLHASNLVGIPVLAIHGAEDDNVPPRHSRAHIAAIAAWAGNEEKFKLLEVPQRGHIWADIFRHPEVTRWIDCLTPKESWDDQRKRGFTLTCANPQECGGRAGIRIRELEMPGRLARLEVVGRQSSVAGAQGPEMRGKNVKSLFVTNEQGTQLLFHRMGGSWSISACAEALTPPRACGPMIRILATSAPLVIVRGVTQALHCLARRLSHDIVVHHRIDVIIMDPREALERLASGDVTGNMVCLGRPEENELVDWMVTQRKIPLAFPTKGVLLINDEPVYEAGTGIITLHPHPLENHSLAVIIAGNDDLGLELAARLFPIRTGVMMPDWAVVSSCMRWMAAGGLIGAGFWGPEWRYSEAMSWLDR